MARVNRDQQKKRVSSAPIATLVGPEDSRNDYPKQTLYDQIREKRLPLLHNIVIIGRLRNTWDKQPELGEYYQNFISSLPSLLEKNLDHRELEIAEGNKIPAASGLLLIFPTLFVHSLEVTNAAMKLFLEDLDRAVKDPDGLIREASVLNISYNISLRIYPNWTFKSIKLAVEDLDAQPAETTDAIALEVLGKLLTLAKHQLDERRKEDRPVDILATIDQQRIDLLPNQANINYLLKQPIFRTADDILKNYVRPINVRFESDLTAPPTHRLFPIAF